MTTWQRLYPEQKAVILVIPLGFLVICFNVFMYFSSSGCQRTPAEPTALTPVEVATDWDDAWRSRLEQVCLEGHTYYYANRGERGAILAPKLNDDGTPVKCGPVVEKP